MHTVCLCLLGGTVLSDAIVALQEWACMLPVHSCLLCLNGLQSLLVATVSSSTIAKLPASCRLISMTLSFNRCQVAACCRRLLAIKTACCLLFQSLYSCCLLCVCQRGCETTAGTSTYTQHRVFVLHACRQGHVQKTARLTDVGPSTSAAAASMHTQCPG